MEQVKNVIKVKLEIVGAKNIAVKGRCKDSLFVRYHVEKNTRVDTKEVEASSEPQWGQTFQLECGGKGIYDMFSELLVFEVRRRSRRVFGGLKKPSKVVGRLQIPWKELLLTLSINNCFLLQSSVTRGLPPTLELTISLTLPSSLAIQIYEGEKESIYDRCKDSWDGEAMHESRNVSRVNRYARRLDRDQCACGGRICLAHQEENGVKF